MMIVFSTPFTGSFDIQADAFAAFDGYDTRSSSNIP